MLAEGGGGDQTKILQVNNNIIVERGVGFWHTGSTRSRLVEVVPSGVLAQVFPRQRFLGVPRVFQGCSMRVPRRNAGMQECRNGTLVDFPLFVLEQTYDSWFSLGGKNRYPGG